MSPNLILHQAHTWSVGIMRYLWLGFGGKAGDGFCLRIKRFKYGYQFGDNQQLIQAIAQIEQLHLSACLLHLRVGGDQLTKPAAVHIADVGQINEQPAASTCDRALDMMFEISITSQSKSAVEIEHRYIV